MTTLQALPPDLQLKARLAYYDGISYAFIASTGIAAAAIVASLFASNAGPRSTS